VDQIKHRTPRAQAKGRRPEAALQTTFDYEFRVAERRAGARLLRRVLYPARRIDFNVVILIGPVALAAVALAGRFLGWWDETGQFLGLVAAFAFLLLLRFGLRQMARKAPPPASVQANEGRQVKFVFSETGYSMTSEFFDGMQRWPGVHCIIAGEGVTLFVISDMAHILPDRTFATPADRTAFLAWALERLTPEAQARSRV